MVNSIVARYADGRIVKGTSLDVAQDRPTCHVRTATGDMVEVELKDLKALFFVKSLDGDRTHQEGTTVDPADPRLRGARLVEVTFHDGERVVGLALRYPPNKPYFFLTPADSVSNNLRILVNRAQIATMGVVGA
ncbi:MAG: hypothetical protein IT361_09850 [Gemmatimonadaceae bacterium]|nr:hypothetical protein [Gemmatimonadaceae bacterium]